MASKRATIYLRERTLAALGQSPEGELSQRIAAMLVRFESICRSLMPEFSRAEWGAIMDANNGGTDLWVADVDGYAGGTLIWANVHDSVGLGEKWDINQAKLVKRLQRLSPAELVAVDEAISRFWNHCNLKTNAALEAAWCKISDEVPPQRNKS
jgi:hypothetical protein